MRADGVRIQAPQPSARAGRVLAAEVEGAGDSGLDGVLAAEVEGAGDSGLDGYECVLW